jgi:hypothetical protein
VYEKKLMKRNGYIAGAFSNGVAKNVAGDKGIKKRPFGLLYDAYT